MPFRVEVTLVFAIALLPRLAFAIWAIGTGGDTEIYFKATAMVDYVFLPYNADIWVPGENVATAGEQDSWGSIKSSFSN